MAKGKDKAQKKDDLADADVAWIAKQVAACCERYGQPADRKVFANRRGTSITVKIGQKGGPPRKLGLLTFDELSRKDTDAIDRMFWLRRVIWVDVAAPIGDVKWADFAAPLRAAGWALGKLQNAAVDECRLTDRKAVKGEDGGKRVPLDTLAYRVVTSEEELKRLHDEADAEVKRLEKALKPLEQLEKQKALTNPAKQRKEAIEALLLQWRTKRDFMLSGAVASCASRSVVTLYKRWKKGEIGYPSFSSETIPLRADSFKLGYREHTSKDGKTEKRYMVEFRVGGRGFDRQQAWIAPKGGSAWDAVRRIYAGEYLVADGKLRWDERKRRWRMAITYSMPRKPVKPVADGKALVVRRSARDVLYVMDSSGKEFGECKGVGSRLISRKRQMLRRRSEVRSALQSRGSGSRNRGRRNRKRHYGYLNDLEARIVDTSLKQLASAIRKACRRSGAEIVYLEDFAHASVAPALLKHEDEFFVKLFERMPWRRAEDVLRAELEEHGIRLVSIVNAHDVSSCPACDSDNVEVDEQRRFRCYGCNEVMVHAHYIAGWNMFRSAGLDTKALAEVARKGIYMTRAAQRREGLDEAEAELKGDAAE